jgi:hypothetical protein
LEFSFRTGSWQLSRKIGVMEYWNNGVLGSKSITQVLQHSITPILHT